MLHFKAKLERLLDERETNKSRIAKAIDVQDAVVRRWGNGKSEPSDSQLFRLCRELNIPLDYLLDDKQMTPPAPPGDQSSDEAYVLKGYRELVAEIGLTPTLAVRKMGRPDDRPAPGSNTRYEPPGS